MHRQYEMSVLAFIAIYLGSWAHAADSTDAARELLKPEEQRQAVALEAKRELEDYLSGANCELVRSFQPSAFDSSSQLNIIRGKASRAESKQDWDAMFEADQAAYSVIRLLVVQIHTDVHDPNWWFARAMGLIVDAKTLPKAATRPVMPMPEEVRLAVAKSAVLWIDLGSANDAGFSPAIRDVVQSKAFYENLASSGQFANLILFSRPPAQMAMEMADRGFAGDAADLLSRIVDALALKKGEDAPLRALILVFRRQWSDAEAIIGGVRPGNREMLQVCEATEMAHSGDRASARRILSEVTLGLENIQPGEPEQLRKTRVQGGYDFIARRCAAARLIEDARIYAAKASGQAFQVDSVDPAYITDVLVDDAISRGDLKEALKLLEKQADGPVSSIRLIATLILAGKVDDAEAELRKLGWEKDPVALKGNCGMAIRARLKIIDGYFKAGKVAEADQQMDSVVGEISRLDELANAADNRRNGVRLSAGMNDALDLWPEAARTKFDMGKYEDGLKLLQNHQVRRQEESAISLGVALARNDDLVKVEKLLAQASDLERAQVYWGVAVGLTQLIKEQSTKLSAPGDENAANPQG